MSREIEDKKRWATDLARCIRCNSVKVSGARARIIFKICDWPTCGSLCMIFPGEASGGINFLIKKTALNDKDGAPFQIALINPKNLVPTQHVEERMTQDGSNVASPV